MSNVDFEQNTPSGSGNDNNDNNNNNNPNCSRLASIRNYKLANWFPQVSFVYPLISHSPYPSSSIRFSPAHLCLLDNFHTAPADGFHSWQIKLKCSLFGIKYTMT